MRINASHQGVQCYWELRKLNGKNHRGTLVAARSVTSKGTVTNKDREGRTNLASVNLREVDLWHQRPGQVNDQVLSKVMKGDAVKRVEG